jgi:hypothetical protein
MARHKFLRLIGSDNPKILSALCTDSATLAWLTDEVRKHFPAAKIKSVPKGYVYEPKLPNGESCYWECDDGYGKLNQETWVSLESMWIWLTKQLLERGWKPINSERGYITLTLSED